MALFQKKEDDIMYDLIIGPHSRVTGNLECDASIRIDGEIIGDVIAKGDIIISDNGVVTGNVKCKNISLHGKCVGNVSALGKIDLSQSSTLIGDIVCVILNTKSGAHFEGQCRVLPETDFEIITNVKKQETGNVFSDPETTNAYEANQIEDVSESDDMAYEDNIDSIA